MASVGHSAAQVPHPAQAALMTWAVCFLPPVMAEKGQTSTQMPHCLHSSGSTTAVMASTLMYGELSRISARAAAALACVTESLMSFGASAQPAMYTPLVGVSTGLSLGCASMRKPPFARERVRCWRMTSVAWRGIVPTESTSRSNSCSSKVPVVVFSA